MVRARVKVRLFVRCTMRIGLWFELGSRLNVRVTTRLRFRVMLWSRRH